MTLGWIGNGVTYGSSALWYAASQSIGLFFMAAVLVKQMRNSNFVSVPDWFDDRYKHKFLNIVAAIACLIVPLSQITGQITAASRMLESIGVPFLVGVIVVGGIVIIYSTVGGYLAVAYTDAIQWLILLAIFVCTVPFAIYYAGGFGAVVRGTSSDMLNVMTVPNMPAYTIILWVVKGFVAALGDQTSYQRIYSAKSEKVAKRGVFWTGIATVFFAVVTTFIGLSVAKLGVPAGTVSDSVWPWFLNNYMPGWVAVIYTMCIMMATMSTADSMLNSISLSITHDIYSKYINPKADDKKVLKIGIAVSAVCGILAIYLATGGSLITTLFGMGYTLGAGPLAGAVVLCAVMKKKANPRYLALGIICGAVMGFLTLQVPALAAIPAGGAVFSLATCLIVGFVGSKVAKPETVQESEAE